ncbi:uncharacterized protein [Littorina saxatilis]|uniref:uncharacterized protein isoform X1 n=1 Tax=Littorina saxatilis TaxID=31220 RepID=UPI0038B5CB41
MRPLKTANSVFTFQCGMSSIDIKMASSAKENNGDGTTWSEPVPLSEAVDRATRSPVFIRLEEGHRGDTAQLSFSVDDTMALEGVKVSRGRRLVLAHYTSTDTEHEDIYGDASSRAASGLYCALLTLPYELLPDIDVSIREDPDGHFYRNFLATNFPDYNWKEQQAELLESLDGHDYTNVSIITPKPRRDPKSGENGGLRRPPPPPPPNPKPKPKPRSTNNNSRNPKEVDESGNPCPPRPPKPMSMFISATPREVPPPRPPRRSPSQVNAEPGIGVGNPGNIISTTTIGEVFAASKKADDSEVDEDEDEDEDGNYEYIDETYDVVDERTMDEKYDLPSTQEQEAKERIPKEERKGGEQKRTGEGPKTLPVRPTVRVPPLRPEGVPVRPGDRSLDDRPPMPVPGEHVYDLDHPPAQNYVTSPLREMTCDELYVRLQTCGLPELAAVCKKNLVDGAFFLQLDEETLSKPPFSLTNFQKIKVTMVKAGWVPR